MFILQRQLGSVLCMVEKTLVTMSKSNSGLRLKQRSRDWASNLGIFLMYFIKLYFNCARHYIYIV